VNTIWIEEKQLDRALRRNEALIPRLSPMRSASEKQFLISISWGHAAYKIVQSKLVANRCLTWSEEALELRPK
jgi:hypothetical protein